MKENLKIKHSLDPMLNKSLIEDTLILMGDKGLNETLLFKSLSLYLKNEIQPFTSLELYKACKLYLSDQNIEERIILKYATDKRIEKDQEKELENLREYTRSLGYYSKSINRKIDDLKDMIQNLELEHETIKAISYDTQKLENAKDLKNNRIITYISDKKRLEEQIQQYEKLKLKISMNIEQLKKMDLKEYDLVKKEVFKKL